MNRHEQIIRAWKDPAYRASLTEEEQASLPESPVGQPGVGLEEALLGLVAGGGRPAHTGFLKVTGCGTRNTLPLPLTSTGPDL